MKVTFLSLHPSTRTPPRSDLTAAHSRRCQAEIILSVKLSNEARHTHAPKNKHTPELWESTFAFEEWWGVVGRIKWMNEKECLFLCRSLWSLFHLIFEDCRFNKNECNLLIYCKCNFPFSGNTLIEPKRSVMCRLYYITQTQLSSRCVFMTPEVSQRTALLTM